MLGNELVVCWHTPDRDSRVCNRKVARVTMMRGPQTLTGRLVGRCSRGSRRRDDADGDFVHGDHEYTPRGLGVRLVRAAILFGFIVEGSWKLP